MSLMPEASGAMARPSRPDPRMGLFDLQPTVTLQTNTFFEGADTFIAGALKDKRSDWFRSAARVPDGEAGTGQVGWMSTAGMLEALEAPRGALVVMDRGVRDPRGS